MTKKEHRKHLAMTKISKETILAAKAGDAQAMDTIIRHYTPYMMSLSKRTIYDECGNPHTVVDNDIVQQLTEKLMVGIVLHFDPERIPTEETPED